MEKTYIAIDLKSFYASVECVDRDFDPLTTNLVVADEERTNKTICLAVTPALKAYGIPGRARLWEVQKAVKEINNTRRNTALRLGVLPKDEEGFYQFSGSSFSAEQLADDPTLELSFLIAPPRMKLYEEISTKIFSIYMRYVSAEDILVYSIDECFIDVTGYLSHYHMSAHDLAMTMIREVLYETGISATAGIGTNLYLAKVAMDIVSKHVPADSNGVRIAELNERTYRELLWCHTPLTDFWNLGPGTAKKLRAMKCHTMGDVARASMTQWEVLYKMFGVKAELVIDHAWGYEPVDIPTIKSYRPGSKSISSGQVLKEPYSSTLARVIVLEMTELLVLDLVRQCLVTKKITLTINYDVTSIEPAPKQPRNKSKEELAYIVTTTKNPYNGKVSIDGYGRVVPSHAHGTGNLDTWTASTKAICDCMMQLYDRIVDPDLLIRQVNVCAFQVISEKDIPVDTAPVQLELFVNYEEIERQQAERKRKEEREKALQRTTLSLQDRFGKNAVLKGINLIKGAMTIERNGQIGGHRAGDGNENADGRGAGGEIPWQ